MFIRLTKKLAEVVNGIDISHCSEGDVIELPDAHAAMLIAERWAEPAPDESSTCEPVALRDARAVAADRGRQRRNDDKGRDVAPPSESPAVPDSSTPSMDHSES